MAFDDLEYHKTKKEIEKFVERIRRPNLRNELGIVFTIEGQIVDIYEERPAFRGPPGEKIRFEIARITYVRPKNVWKLYWMRQNMKWELYDQPPTLEVALKLIAADEHGCFFG